VSPQDYSPSAFIKALNAIDRSKSPGEKFRDFCEMAYCAYAKLTAPDKERADALENRYMEIVGNYRDKDDVRKYPELLGMAIAGLEDGLDYLGEVSNQLEILNPKQGQFFTPMSVCTMMAHVILDKESIEQDIAEDGYFRMYEPAAGGGAMILASANRLRQLGFDPAIHMLTYAADISQLAYWMCYIQLSAIDIPAFVTRENSLSLERFDGAWTPAAIWFAAHHRHLNFTKPSKAPKPDLQDIPTMPEQSIQALRQMKMF
jgi:hypothetical protein